jgi:diguanylate cyclase (GGDEF)-like protein
VNLDIRTIFVTVSVIVLGNAFISTLAWRYARSLRSIIGYWSLGQVLVGIGTVMVALRTVIPDVFSILLANACILGGQVATQEGFARYMGKEGTYRKVNLIVLTIMVLAFVYFTYVNPSVSHRIVVYSLAAFLISLGSMITLRTNDTEEDAPRYFLIALLAFHLCLMVFRAFSAISQGEYAEFLNSGAWQAWGMIAALSFYASLAISFFWLIAHRLGLDTQKLAFTDSLTGLSNRRAMDHLLEKLLPVLLERNIGFLLMDVDDFKGINDKFGHQAGDSYLVHLGRKISENLRSGDRVFRYAGDEFVVLTRDGDESSALHTAERLRQRIEELAVPWQGKELRSTVSIGLTLSNTHVRISDDLMRVADKALYRAKAEGGNRVVFDE